MQININQSMQQDLKRSISQVNANLSGTAFLPNLIVFLVFQKIKRHAISTIIELGKNWKHQNERFLSDDDNENIHIMNSQQ